MRATSENPTRQAATPPPPPPEATGVVPIFQRRRTLIEDPRGAAVDAAESVVTYSFLQGALLTCAAIAVWAAYGIGTSLPTASRWHVTGAAVLAGLLALLAWRAGRNARITSQRLIATGSEPRHAEVTASRESKRDLNVVRVAATLAPPYVVFGIADLQIASIPLLGAAAILAFGAIAFARRTADRLGTARYATRVIGFREERAN
ncbi:MAG: hypothetical protein ACAI38_04615 [Myxococcota bacterium]|nr:hypothetical protein [Myxococcota bacterium]